METGKAESPDRDAGAQRYVVVSEHRRLKDAVVEKAKARRAAELQFDKQLSTGPSLMVAEIAEDEAVDALIAFESEHKLGE